MPIQCRKSSQLRRWLPLMLPLALIVAASVASAAPAAVADHVVISEVETLTNAATNRPLCSEFVEIHNPTAAAIELGQYYLTDATFSSNNVGYWRIAEGSPSATTAGGGAVADFHARFPTGYAIAAGDTVVISIAGSTAYQAAYGRLPDFELYEDGDVPDGVPELVEVFPGSIRTSGGTAPTLTDNGESLVLYRWDRSSDLVQDVDYMRWGADATVAVNKTGVTVGASTYLADTVASSQGTVTTAPTTVHGNAYARMSADEGTEGLAGGNGLNGHNETSENFATTWRVTLQSPPLAPLTPYATAPIVTGHAQIPSTPVNGETVTVSVTALSASAVSAVVFHYTVNGGAASPLTGTAAGADTWSAVIPAQAVGAVVGWYAVVTNAAGGSATYPAAAPGFDITWTVIAPPPPTITAFGTIPTAPYADLSTTVSVTATSLSPVSGAVFHYSVGGGAFASLTGTTQGGGVYTATVPSQDEGAVVTWYVVVTNQAALSVSSPADAPTSTHSWTVIAAPEPKLLLTEVCVLGTPQEFVEICNPGTRSVDMSDYYLTDAVHVPANSGYWNMGGGTLSSAAVGGGDYTDFTARFPAGFLIAAGDTIVVSIAGSTAFSASFGFLPDLELYEDDAFPDGVPDMRSIFAEPANSIITALSIPTLTNGGGTSATASAGELVVLFQWTEGTALTVDVDIFVWKVASYGTSYMFAKTGKTVGGATYAPDTAVASQTPFASGSPIAFGNSYVRIDGSEGSQILTGSNGIGGRDELSENFNATWAMLPSNPSQPGTGGEGGGIIEMVVPAKTFLPSLGETFPVKITSRPRSETRLRLYDREGRLVRSLFDSRANGAPSTTPGSYTTITWNGLDETLQRVNGGMYVLHLSVVDKATGVEETRTAPVVVATRLSR
jgi:hypothetical protein